MPKQLVMTVLGEDRPGIVEDLSAAISGAGGNWLESRMANLAGHFAGVLRVEVNAEGQAALATALGEVEGVTIDLASGEESTAEAGETLQLEVVGHDRPGIVSEIAAAVASQGANVEELETGTESAPMSGETHFRAQLEIRLAPGSDEEKLRAALENVGDDLMVDLK